MAAPHQRLLNPPYAVPDSVSVQEQLLASLFDRLWATYRQQVPWVQVYEQVINDANAVFVNDHIAFRTLASQTPMLGISSLARVFHALGYQAAGCYHFPGKHLSALHLQHPRQNFPKLFISELRLWELPPDAQLAAQPSLDSHQSLVTNALLSHLAQSLVHDEVESFSEQLSQIFQRPGAPPEWRDVERMNAVSQYGAWTLLHGYRVNHFTSLVNSHQVPALADLEKTVAALKAAGVAMKEEIEGAVGSKLRQTATTAAMSEVEVSRDGVSSTAEWTYAYFELAERGMVLDAETQVKQRFEGFLGAQATQLFEMTRGG